MREKNIKKLNGLSLKIVAIVTMLVDHIAAGVLYYIMLADNSELYYLDYDKYCKINAIYISGRIIGRTAFPIFCFLLVEGLFHTRNRWKYFRNLLIFAFVSEIPFDFALETLYRIKTFDVVRVFSLNYELFMDYQNVFFTLAFGFMAIWIIEIMIKNNGRGGKATMMLGGGFIALIMALAEFVVKSDYGMLGVLLIMVFYLFHERRLVAVVVGYLLMVMGMGINGYSMEACSIAGFVLILLYNGERGYSGNALKYTFYAFYPVHLLMIFVGRVLVLR